MTPAEQVVKALREQARQHEVAASIITCGSQAAAVRDPLLRGADQMDALADFVEAADKCRLVLKVSQALPQSQVADYDAALARLAEVMESGGKS